MPNTINTRGSSASRIPYKENSGMKQFGKISLFMITASIIYAAGAYTGNWFYPNRNYTEKIYETSEDKTESTPLKQFTDVAETEVVPVPVVSQNIELNADTEYVVEEYDIGMDSVTEVKDKLPAKYIGMNRDTFIEAMGEYETAPSMADLEKGFLSLEVISFSPDKVVIRKTYQTSVQSDQFYLVAEDNFVVVYYGDLNTLFMHTDIALDTLPKELQEEIIQVKYVTGEGELYTFLESYSS